MASILRAGIAVAVGMLFAQAQAQYTPAAQVAPQTQSAMPASSQSLGYSPAPGFMPGQGGYPGAQQGGVGVGSPTLYGSQQGGMPGQMYTPNAQPRAKEVGKGYIHYSFKSDGKEPVAQQTTDAQGQVIDSDRGQLYVIKRGDNLWNLAGSFLDDPWRWKDIWEQNQYILNPDLIYPGRDILLGYAAVMANASQNNPPIDSSYILNPKSFTDATAGFLEDTTTANADSVELAQKQEDEFRTLHMLIRKKILTPEFLASAPILWRQKDSKGLLYPGDARIDPNVTRESFQQFEEVPIKVFGKTQYQVGDTLQIFRSMRMVNYKKKPANMVRRIGYARVIEVKRDKLKATLFQVWDVVKAGDRVGKAETFPRIAVGEYTVPDQQVQAGVFERVELTMFPYPYHTFIADRGTADGVKLGDLFLAYATTAKEPSPAPVQLACVVHVENDYATLATVQLYNNTLAPGDKVALVKRMQTAQ